MSTKTKAHLLLNTTKMAFIKFLVQFKAFVFVSMPFISACSLDSDCISLDSYEPAQCCNGKCMGKYIKCPLWSDDATAGLVFSCGVVAIVILLCCCCCSCCPGYRYRSRSSVSFISRVVPPYQRLMDHATATNMASSSLGVGVFYPQPPFKTQQYSMRHPMEVEDDLDSFT